VPVEHEPLLPQLPTQSSFMPYVLSDRDVKRLLSLCATLTRPAFRAPLFRMLLLVLYCTGIRFGEALQLRYGDVDVPAGVLFVRAFKGRARWVPFHRSLAREMNKYLLARQSFTGSLAGPNERFFVGANRKVLSVSSAGHTIQRLFQKTGLKPAQRLCPLWPETATALRQIVNSESENETVFRNSRGAPMSRDGVAYILQKYVRQASETLPHLRAIRVTPHVMRHSCAVALLQAGIDVSVIRDYLGHASVATTSRYITSNLRMKREVLDAFWKRSGLIPGSTKPWRPSPKLLDFLQAL